MVPVTQRKWQLRKVVPQVEVLAADMANHLGINSLTAELLIMRGADDLTSAENFLHANLTSLPDPSLLPGMEAACSRLVKALENKESIAVHGDYDVDGITGSSLLVEVLRDLGADVSYHIPLRLTDGYGLSAEALRDAAQAGCRLVISVDCGVSAVVEALLAVDLGLDLIITDHHQPPEELPRCLALINPHLSESRFPFKSLSGVGVAFMFLLGLRRVLRQRNYFTGRTEPDLRYSLDLVALGTVADLVPLNGVNRALVRTGLKLLEKGNRPGIAALKRVADVKTVTSGSVGFRLAPRLNAAGRLEDATLGVQLLLNDEEQDKNELATLLDGFNRERQQLEQQTFDEALTMLALDDTDNAHSIVLARNNWHPGVIGIVASRLVERYHRPTVLIALDNDSIGKGSARSVANFHLYNAFKECEDCFVGFGGHAMAAGLTIEAHQIDLFRQRFEQLAQQWLSDDDLIPSIGYDGEIALTQLNIDLLYEMEQLNPFGMGNPQPAFVSRNCTVFNPRILKEKHLKFSVEQDDARFDCIAFGQSEKFDSCTGHIDILYRPSINEWRGHKSVQLQIVDFKALE
jgi:single-stranded-DNA-specific exonuclease